MSRSRQSIVDLDSTLYYHCISRCVRQAYLCGKDKFSGKNFSHRREWLTERVLWLSSFFSIGICAFSVMENHYHIVLKVNRNHALLLTEAEIVRRWTSVYCAGHPLVERYQLGLGCEAENIAAKQIIEVWRERLYSISWFMRNINEYTAKRANKEDDCKGRFWEGRFKSQALLDQDAILNCMIYVDLNPIRAGIATTLQDSDFTSIQARIDAYQEAQQQSLEQSSQSSQSVEPAEIGESVAQVECLDSQPKSLLPFGEISDQTQDIIHFSLLNYLELADWTGRKIHPTKKGFIDADTPKILDELNIEEDDWLDLSRRFEQRFAYFAGHAPSLNYHAHHHGEHWYKGVG
ncbi:MAG: REP element-mobilizing transposase RayT [Phenylobacterium sp.]|jgi:REP element-mobilizing transposase RayT